MKDSSDVTTILVAFVQQFWLAIWALVLLFFLLYADPEVINKIRTLARESSGDWTRAVADQK